MFFIGKALFPLFVELSNEHGQEVFKAKIDHMGNYGIFNLIGLYLIQVLIPFLPAGPVKILSGMCYGTWGGILVLILGMLLSSTIVFFLVQKFGRDFLAMFFSQKQIDKLENLPFFQNQKKLELTVFLLFLIPGTPKELLVYSGGLLPIKPLRFILISTFARVPALISSTICGANLLNRNWPLIIISYGITFFIAGLLFIWFYFYQKRNNTT